MGYRVILTQDKTFVQDAAHVLKLYPSFCVVVLVVAQTPAKTFLDRFREQWQVTPIVPKEGDVVFWPPNL